jgi:hypothetical protein
MFVFSHKWEYVCLAKENPLPAEATVEGPTICRREIEILLFKLVYQDLLAVAAVTAFFTCFHN